jgi:hypothetical protein
MTLLEPGSEDLLELDTFHPNDTHCLEDLQYYHNMPGVYKNKKTEICKFNIKNNQIPISKEHGLNLSE